MGDMSTCCKSEWGQQHTCSLRKGRYWGPKLHEGFFFFAKLPKEKKVGTREQGRGVQELQWKNGNKIQCVFRERSYTGGRKNGYLIHTTVDQKTSNFPQ